MMTRTLLFPIASLFILGAGSTAGAASVEDVNIWRTQLRIHTCDKDNAGTDSHVSVVLNDFQSTSFYLRVPNDKDRNETNTYDIFIPEVTQIRDITQLTIEIHGSNRWCFDRVELLVNSNPGGNGGNSTGIPIFVFQTSTGQWLDRTNGPTRFTRSGAALRAHPNWSDFVGSLIQTLPGRVKRSQIEAMVMGIVGDFVARDPDVQWGGLNGSSYVELTPPTTQAGVLLPTRVDLDLERQSVFEKNLDVDFTLSSKCTDLGSTIAIEFFTSDVDVDLFELFPFFDTLLPNVDFGISAAFKASGFSSCPAKMGFDNLGDWTWSL